MQLGLIPTGEQAGRFEHYIDIQFFPREIRWITILQNLNFVTAHDDIFVVVPNLSVEFAVHRVPFEQMCQGMRVGEIVHRPNTLHLFL